MTTADDLMKRLIEEDNDPASSFLKVLPKGQMNVVSISELYKSLNKSYGSSVANEFLQFTISGDKPKNIEPIREFLRGNKDYISRTCLAQLEA